MHYEPMPAVDQSPPAVSHKVELDADVGSRPVEHVPAPSVAPQPSAVAALVHEPPMPRNAPELPRISLDLPPESGLVLVETSHDRAPVATAEAEAEAARPKRVRPARVEKQDEPLQMVETTHKDSTPPAE